MKLTSDKALQILEVKKSNEESNGWIEHSICVGNAARAIAKSLNLDEYLK